MVKKINLFNRFKIKLTNKWLYSFIALGIVLILGIVVYAIPPPPVPNPGHAISELQTCSTGKILQTNSNGNWSCVDMPSTGTILPDCDYDQIIQRCNPIPPGGTADVISGNVIAGTCTDSGWGCADMPSGGVLAPNSVTTDHIVDGTIASVDIAEGAVTTFKLDNNSVTGSKVVDESLTAYDDLSYGTVLKLRPQTSPPFECNASTVGALYIKQIQDGSGPIEKAYTLYVCTADYYYVGDSLIFNCFNIDNHFCEHTNTCNPCDAGDPGCIEYTCDPYEISDYSWREVYS